MPQRLGQHFLRDKGILQKTVALLELKDGDRVVEIGAGDGELTGEIAAMGKKIRISAIEKDERLAWLLRRKFAEREEVEVVEGDALRLLGPLTEKIGLPNYKIIGNIPYYITGHLFRIIGGLENKPLLCSFMIQEEVALRMTSEAPRFNRMAASVQFWAEVRLELKVSRKAFSPPPKVDSAVVLLRRRPTPNWQKNLENQYERVVGLMFAQPRKTVLNNLSSGLAIPKEEVANLLMDAGIDPVCRPQNLSVKKLLALARKISPIAYN